MNRQKIAVVVTRLALGIAMSVLAFAAEIVLVRAGGRSQTAQAPSTQRPRATAET